MSAKIVQITACVDWYFVDELNRMNPIVEPVAAWALLETGDVVGLKVEGPGAAGHPKLVQIVNTNGDGIFVLYRNLNESQRKIANISVPEKV